MRSWRTLGLIVGDVSCGERKGSETLPSFSFLHVLEISVAEKQFMISGYFTLTFSLILSCYRYTLVGVRSWDDII